jgi:hypothetical protein
MIKLSIIINDEAYEQAKLLAEESGLGVAEWIEELIEDTCEPDELDPISDLQARVTAIETILQSREAAKEEATEVESGSQEDKARSQATEEGFVEVTDGVVERGDQIRLLHLKFPAHHCVGQVVRDLSSVGARVYRRK